MDSEVARGCAASKNSSEASRACKHRNCQHFLQLWPLQERWAPLQLSAVLSRGVQPGQYVCQHGVPYLLELIFEGLIIDVVLPPLGHESLSQVVAEMHLCYCLGCCAAVTMAIVRLFQPSSHETVLYDSRAGCPCRPSAAERGRDIRYVTLYMLRICLTGVHSSVDRPTDTMRESTSRNW